MSAVSQVEFPAREPGARGGASQVPATNCCVFWTRVGTKLGTPNWRAVELSGTRTRDHGDTFRTCGPSPLFFIFFRRTGSDPAASRVLEPKLPVMRRNLKGAPCGVGF